MIKQKFRAWDKEHKVMVDGEYWLFVGQDGRLYEYDDGKMIDRSNDFVVMQDTGLKDKNGKSIWQGDVVSVFSEVDKKKIIGEVDFYDKNAGFYLAGRKPLFDSIVMDTCEVIGNIFEDEELLTDNKEE